MITRGGSVSRQGGHAVLSQGSFSLHILPLCFLLWLCQREKDLGSQSPSGNRDKVSRPGETESDLDVWTLVLLVHSDHLSEVYSLPAGRDLSVLKRSSQNFLVTLILAP